MNNLRSWMRSQGAPVTVSIIASLVLCALLFWFTAAKDIANFVVLSDSHQRPWTFVTYAWASMPFGDGLSILFFAFLMMWLYSFGNTLEREMGRSKFITLWFVAVVGVALSMWLGMQFLGSSRPVNGAYLAISALTMVWCARNMTQVIMLNGFIPLSGKWLAVVDGVVAILIYGNGQPLLGAFAALPLAFAFLFGMGRLPGLSYEKKRVVQETRAQTRYRPEYFDDVRKREQERAEREKLRKLLESSVEDDER